MSGEITSTDTYDQRLGGFLPPQAVKELSQIKAWRGLLQIALEWFGVIGAIMLCEAYWSLPLYFITMAWIGARQNALAVIMHEAVHYRLLKNRAWNEWIGEIFTAWPLLITAYGYRQTHFAHHRHVNKPNDPDWQRQQHNTAKYYPKTLREFTWITLKYWFGFYAIAELKEFEQEAKIPSSIQIPRLCFFAAIGVATVVFNLWLGILLYWLIPLFTFFLWFIYLRTITEHSRENYEDLLKKTRHVEANFFERLTVAPNNIYVHIGHHLYPSVPFYNLRKLHALLLKNPEFNNRAHVSKSYLDLIKESIAFNGQYEAKAAGIAAA
jgi:fatty acid desaturase